MFCGYCGKEISEDYSFCTGCGKPLDRGTTDQTFQSEDKEKKYESSPQDTQDVEYNETNPLDQSIELKPELDIPTIFHQEEQNFETHEESLPTSKYISVKFWKHCDWPWQARSLDGKNILGTYGTELEAAEAVAKFHGITVDVLLEEGINLTEDEVEEKKRLLIEKALIKSKSTPSPMSIDKLWNAPPKKSPSTEDSASYDSPFSESLPAGLTNTPMPILGKEDAPLGKLMTDQLSENQNQKLEKKPPPIWEPITLVICAYIWGLLLQFNWEVERAIYMITHAPMVLFGASGMVLMLVIGLIHLAISQFYKNKRNSYSRRYIIIYWSLAAFAILLLASYGQAKHRGEDVTQDYKEDEKWDRKAAEQGNSEAQSRRGLIYEKETEKGLTQRTIVPPQKASTSGGNRGIVVVPSKKIDMGIWATEENQGELLLSDDLLKKTSREKNKVSEEEELAGKMTDYYKGASDQEIDKFIIGLTNAKKKVLPNKLNQGITLYEVEYIKDGNVVGYAYEVNADNLGLSEKELIANKQTVTNNLREHHKRYFCTTPAIRMELDIGIDFFITIVSAIDNNVGSYRISKGDCIN